MSDLEERIDDMLWEIACDLNKYEVESPYVENLREADFEMLKETYKPQLFSIIEEEKKESRIDELEGLKPFTCVGEITDGKVEIHEATIEFKAKYINERTKELRGEDD